MWRNDLVDDVLAGKFDHLKEERMASTLPTIDWQKDDHTPPRSNEDVTQIMLVEGVSRRRAYRILQQRRAAEVDISNVSEGQRVAVLGVLINVHESRKDVHSLIEECHAVGVKIDGHDVTKTLFALQHQGFVRFRERNRPRTLYAIVVTHAGNDAWLRRNPSKNLLLLEEAEASVALDHGEAETQVAEGAHTAKGPVMEVTTVRDPEVVAAIEGARMLQQAVNALGAGPKDIVNPDGNAPGTPRWKYNGADLVEGPQSNPDDFIYRPWIKYSLTGWPMFRAIRDRYTRAQKLNAAAKLLEEAGGQDEMVLTLMGETEFTQLEEEVLELLKKCGEIE
jgi:Fe2+ or Zn2+ uptake regulation protein